LIGAKRRLLTILLGYGAACLASGIIVAAAFLLFDPVSPSNAINLPSIADILGISIIITGLVAIKAALPALLAVIYSEIQPVRSRSYFIAAGFVTGGFTPAFQYLDLWYYGLGMGFGPIAGLIYWYIAGRNAGIVLASKPTVT
jgi:hypothetical protein